MPDTLNLPNITEETLEQATPEDIINIKKLLQTINDTLQGGLRSANMVEYRNTYVINAQDSLDANYPLYVHFNIIPEMVKIVSINVSFWFLNFRAYSTAASSGGAVSSAIGGGETPTSSSGGEVTSASGGGETPTTSSGGGQTSSSVTTPSGGGSTSGASGSASGGGSTSGAGGATTPTSSVDSYGTVQGYLPTAAPSYSANIGDANINGFVITTSIAYTLSTKNHTHTVTIGNHYHSTPNHTHPNHYHSTPNHTHPAHTHTVANHTHTVTIAAHTHTGGAHAHTVTVAAHTHTGGAHTHGITYGIFEDSTSPTVMIYVSRDNGLTYSLPLGSYTEDHENLDITNKIDTVGSKMIKIESNARTRLSVQITIKLDISAR